MLANTPSAWLPISGLVFGLSGLVGACILNPQPLPPDRPDDAGSAATPPAVSLGEGDAARSSLDASKSDASARPADTGTEDSTSNGGSGTEEADGTPEAEPDGSIRPDAAMDGATDGHSDATCDAGEASPD
jgi:hypothetical protein